MAMNSFDTFFSKLPVRQVNGCRHFGPREEDASFIPPRGSEIFVARIPETFTHKELIKIFYAAGQVYDVRLMLTFMKENKGFAFVRYLNSDMAAKAISYLDKHHLPGNNGHLVAMLSTDHRTLMLKGCLSVVTKKEVDEVFRSIEQSELIEVTEQVETGSTSPVFYLLFASHRSAAVVRKSNWKEHIPCRWGPWVRLDWQPNSEVDQRKRFKIERKKYLSLVQNLAAMPLVLRDPSVSSGALTSVPPTANITAQSLPEPMMLDEASNASTFDFSHPPPKLTGGANREGRIQDDFSLPSENFPLTRGSFNAPQGVVHLLPPNQLAGTSGVQAGRNILNVLGTSVTLGGLPLPTTLDQRGNTREQISEDPPANQTCFLSPGAGAWGSSFWSIQHGQSGTIRDLWPRENPPASRGVSSESAGVCGGAPLVPQRDQTDENIQALDCVGCGRPIRGRGNIDQLPKTMRF